MFWGTLILFHVYVSALRTNEAVHHFSEEIVCVLPVINLVISPSKSVKSVASHVLSRFHVLVLDLLASCSSEQQDSSMVHHISKPTSILPKLVHHLWSQVNFCPTYLFAILSWCCACTPFPPFVHWVEMKNKTSIIPS